MLISPLKTTSSALSCSTFMASSSWQASASWASCPGQRETCKSASAWGSWGERERGDSDAHLLQLNHSVLKLDTHRVLLFPSRETNALVRSNRPRLAGCQKGGSGSCAPQSHPRAGDDSTRAGRRTCPGMHRRSFPDDSSCQMPISPPQPRTMPHHTPRCPRHGLACSVTGGAGDTNRRLCVAAAWRQPTAQRSPPASPPIPEALGVTSDSAPRLSKGLAAIAELPLSAPHLQLHFCVCSIAVQAAQKQETQPNAKPCYSVSGHDVRQREGLLFCPYRRRERAAPHPATLPGQGHISMAVLLHNRLDGRTSFHPTRKQEGSSRFMLGWLVGTILGSAALQKAELQGARHFYTKTHRLAITVLYFAA